LATDIVLGLAVMQMAFDETIGNWCEAIIAYPHPEQDPRHFGVTAFASYVRYFFRGQTDAADVVHELVTTTATSSPDTIRLNVLNLGCGLALLNNWPFREMSDRYVEAARTAGDPFHLVHALASHVWACILAGEEATASARDVIAAAQDLGNPSTLAIAYQAEAMSCSVSDPARAIALLDASIEAAASVRSHFTQNVSQSMRSTLVAQSLSPPVAAKALLDALDSPLGHRVPGLSPVKVFELAALLAIGGRPEPAAVLLGARVASSTPRVMWPFAPREFQAALEELPARLGEERWSELRESGRRLSNEDLIELARTEVSQLLPE
jgi:hypothetical protein